LKVEWWFSGHEGSTGNDVEINLAYNTVDEKDCAALGPRLGKRLNAIFREASSHGSTTAGAMFALLRKGASKDPNLILVELQKNGSDLQLRRSRPG
jgi:hypothetical protein